MEKASSHVHEAIYILVPVYEEQAIIIETVHRFCNLPSDHFEIHIVIACTTREKRSSQSEKTTEEVIRDSIDSGTLSPYRDRIQVMVDTHQKGNMATQLNFALEQLRKENSPETIFLLYNADSIISDKTLSALSSLRETSLVNGIAFQQPCAYVRDMDAMSSSFLNALALYQSWYCLGHESRLVHRYAIGKARTNLGIIVGHGSGMMLAVHRNNGGYPENLLTEDLTLGFILSANNVPILPLNALELADVPSTLKSFIIQKSVWFWNYLGYFSCFIHLRRQGYSVYKLIPLLVQGFVGGAYWFFSAGIVLAPILLSLIWASPWVTVVSIASVLVFCILPQYALFKMLPSVLRQQGFSSEAARMENIYFLNILPALFLIVITDSVGPWIALVKGVRYFITGSLPEKAKTRD